MSESVLIVGVGSGLSASLARLCASKGMKVILAARNIDKLKDLKKEVKAETYKWVWDNFVTLNQSIADFNNFKLTLGTTMEERGGDFIEGTRRNVPNDSDFWSLNNGDADPQSVSGLRNNTIRLRSYFARLNYDFDSRLDCFWSI